MDEAREEYPNEPSIITINNELIVIPTSSQLAVNLKPRSNNSRIHLQSLLNSKVVEHQQADSLGVERTERILTNSVPIHGVENNNREMTGFNIAIAGTSRGNERFLSLI